MYVTNLTDNPIGLSGSIILQPKEENRFLDDTGNFYVIALRLKEAGLITINEDSGFLKTFEAEAVKVIEDFVEKVETVVKDEIEEVEEIIAKVKKRGAKKNGTNEVKPNEVKPNEVKPNEASLTSVNSK